MCFAIRLDRVSPYQPGIERTSLKRATQLILAFGIGAVGNNPAFAGLGHEAEELAPDGTELHLGGLLQGLFRVQPALVKKLERSLDFVAIRGAETRPPQSEDIHAKNLILRRDQKGRQVLGESPLRHDDPSDPDALVKARPAADERAVVDSNMPGEQTVIHDDHAVPNLAIVPDVSADHEEIPIAENRGASFRGAAMDGAMLANHVGIADLNSAFDLRLKAEVLRRTSDDRAVPDKIIRRPSAPLPQSRRAIGSRICPR